MSLRFTQLLMKLKIDQIKKIIFLLPKNYFGYRKWFHTTKCRHVGYDEVIH